MAETQAEKTARETKERAERERQERERREQAQKGQSGEKRASKPLAYSPTGPRKIAVDDRGPVILSNEEVNDLAGDLGPGEIGWVKLDEEGNPTGAATKEYPNIKDGPVARVIGSPKAAYDDIVTPSGAPVTKFMNPEPTLWDEGMLARNPIPEKTEKQKEYFDPTGGVVVHQPVLT